MAPSMFPLSLRNSVWFRVQMATLVYIDPGHETESSARRRWIEHSDT